MSEVSREAIAYFKKRIEAEKHIINVPTCDKEVAESKKKHIAYFEQAISDMEKLQKIEEIYLEYNILCSECPADRERGECNDCFVYNIEKVFER